MIILALDTTTRAGSAAVLKDGALAAERVGNPEITHGERLPSDLQQLLADLRLGIEDVDLFAVAAGPGSFTGLRVGIATVQGLAMARGRLVVPVSALEALARAARDVPSPVAAWMDAQRGEVFAEVYAAGSRAILLPAASGTPEARLDAMAGVPGAPIFIGDGAIRYRETIAARGGADVRILHPPPLAAFIGEIASEHPERAVRPHAVVPIYIRRPDAELARARRAAGS